MDSAALASVAARDGLLAELLELSPDREVDVVVLNHAESGEPPPSDYFASSVLLGPLGGLDATLARHIASCAGLRNRIVPEYDELDPQRVFAALESALRDIPVFLAGVESYLERIEAGWVGRCSRSDLTCHTPV